MQTGGFVRTLRKAWKAHANFFLIALSHRRNDKNQFIRAVQDQFVLSPALIPISSCFDQRIIRLCTHNTHIHSDILCNQCTSQITVIFQFVREKTLCTSRTGTFCKKIVSIKYLALLVAEKFYRFLCPLLVKSRSVNLNAGIQLISKCVFGKGIKVGISLLIICIVQICLYRIF